MMFGALPATRKAVDVTTSRLLSHARTIAVLGYSRRPSRDSNAAAACLRNAGYTVVGVNPTATVFDRIQREEQSIFVPVVPSLMDASKFLGMLQPPASIDIVNVFRKPECLVDVLDEIIALPLLPRAVWLQEGISDAVFEKELRRLGVFVVANRDLLKDHIRLLHLGQDDDDKQTMVNSRVA